MITQQDLIDCHNRIEKYVHRTPVVCSRLINKMVGAEVIFKCENFQRMGAFKMRGAVNAILQLSDQERKRGVVTHSSGNFAQAVALAAQIFQTRAFIVMPSNAPQVKKDAVNGYGGEIIECEPTLEARESTAKLAMDKHQATFLHPYNQNEVITGQGTAGLELLQDHPKLDFLFCPVGGGGLIAGCSLAAHYFGRDCKTIGGEPSKVDDAFRSLEVGRIVENQTTDTIADGLKTNLGDLTFPIIQEFVQEIIRVDEDEIITTMKLIWERMKVVVEPSSAVPLAALIKERSRFPGKKIGIVLSGGNVDLQSISSLF